jgi:hypothetical protein
VISKLNEEACEGRLVAFSGPVGRVVALHGIPLRVVVGLDALVTGVQTR